MTQPPIGQPSHVEIFSDGRIVWVNGGDTGGAIGRFGLNGIDVHTADTTGCLHCTHERTEAADWDIFVSKMREHHGVKVGDEHRPERFLAALSRKQS
jgi:hypothetical protein